MRLRKIELEHFLSHERESVALPEQGVFFLDGPSGAGKSSFIVDAPLYALFGPKATRGKQEDLPHMDHPGQPMLVRVTFEHDDGQLLILERGLNELGKPFATASVAASGAAESTIVAEGPQKTDKYVKKRLGGMSWQQLRAAFVCHQKEVAALTDLPPAERKNLVHRLLGVRELELAQREIHERRSKAKASLDQVIARVGERTREGEEERIRLLEQDLAAREQAREELERELQASEAKLKEVQAKLQPLREAAQAKEQIAALEAALHHRSQALKDAQGKLTTQQETERRLTAASAIDQELQEAEQELERLGKSGERSRQHADLTGALQEAESRRTAAQAALEKLAQGADSPATLQAQLAAVAGQRQHLQEEAELHRHDGHLLDEQGVCFTCQRPLASEEERRVVLTAIEDAAANRRRQDGDLVAEEERLRALVPAAERDQETRRSREHDLVAVQAQIDQLAKQMAALAAKGVEPVEELRAAYRAQQKKVGALEAKRGELTALKASVDPSLVQRVEDLKSEQATDEVALKEAKQRAQVEVDPASVAELEAEVQELTQHVGECRGQLSAAATAKSGLETSLAQAQKELAAFRDLLEKRDEHHREVLRVESLADYLGQFTVALAAEIRPQLEEAAGEMLYQMSGGRFVAMEIDQDYNIQIQREEGNWIKPSSVSGGEEVRANLCLRLALTRLVSQRTGVPVQFIVLDEPFGNLDTSLIDASMGLLDSLRSFYPEIFLISHTGDLGSSQHVDYRLAFDGPQGPERVKLYQR